jgi:hypothetical protein
MHNQNILFDALITRHGLKNDAALARQMQMAPPVISKARAGKLPIGASMVLRIHDTCGLSIRDIRLLANGHPIPVSQHDPVLAAKHAPMADGEWRVDGSVA